MVSELEGLTYEEKLKEINLTTLKETRKRRDLTTIHKLINHLEETDRKEHTHVRTHTHTHTHV